MRTVTNHVLVCLVLTAVLFGANSDAAQEARKYDVHDKTRENPPVVTPPESLGRPPADAIVLFDARNGSTAEWERSRREGGDIVWDIVKGDNGYMQVARKAGGIRTKKVFGSCQLHIEWLTPEGVDPKITDQKRSNSGVHFMGEYEVQILDSYTKDNYDDNRTYADGQAAAIYGQHPPMVNVCRPAGQWQTYDISFLAPLFDENGKLLRKARITVLHNGVVVHNNLEIEGTTAHKKKASYTAHGKAPLSLQDHGNPICFRNIWIRELPEQPYLIK